MEETYRVNTFVTVIREVVTTSQTGEGEIIPITIPPGYRMLCIAESAGQVVGDFYGYRVRVDSGDVE